jgi:bifunctional DNA-binding transcriptional regulator/antitoxin component of YhaV-PrlF toxin-antitoxin module
VIPREIRREAALEPGVPLEIRWRDGVIELEPKALPVTLRQKGRLLVAVPVAGVAPLEASAVERVRRSIRRRQSRAR